MKRLIPILVPVLTACTSDVKRAIEERGPAVRVVFDRVQAIHKQLANIPPVTKDGIAAGQGPFSLAFFGSEAAEGKLGTLGIVYEEDLQPLAEGNARDIQRILTAADLPECMSLLTQQKHIGGAANNVHAVNVKRYLDACLAIRTLLVLRQTKSEPPTLFQGDVVAFDLESGKHLGGFAVNVTSDPYAGSSNSTTTTTTKSTRTSVTGRTTTTITKTTSSGAYDKDAEYSRHHGNIAKAVELGINANIAGVQWFR